MKLSVRGGLATLAVLAALVSTVPVGSVLATAVYTFDAGPGLSCIDGTGPFGQALTAVLKSPAGVVLSKKSTAADPEYGHWSVCFDVVVHSHDTLTARHLTVSRTVTVPVLTVHADRATNVVSGRAPPGKPLNVIYQECFAGGCNAPGSAMPVTAGGTGRYALDISPTDIDGSDQLDLSLLTLAGDTFHTQIAAPYFRARDFGRAALFFWKAEPGRITFTLRSSTGVLRATATNDRPTGGGYVYHFRNNGTPVVINRGNIITGDFAADTRMVVPAWSLTGDSGTGYVSGRCYPNQHVSVFVTTSPTSGMSSSANSDSNGDFSAHFTSLESGWKLTADCEDKAGDQLRATGVVP